MASVIDLLFKEYRRRVLALLLLKPEQTYHVREIARLTGTVAGTLHKELSKLAEAGLLNKNTRGNQVSYSANRDSPIFEELASILRKTSGLADVLADALAPLADKIEGAFVYGSVASGTESSHSDIDLLVVGDLEFGQLVKQLYPAQELLGREVNPKLYRSEEWQDWCNTPDKPAFIRELLEKPIINIIGNRDDIGESTR